MDNPMLIGAVISAIFLAVLLTLGRNILEWITLRKVSKTCDSLLKHLNKLKDDGDDGSGDG